MSRLSNLAEANKIIESGMKYIEENLSGYSIRYNPVKKAIADYKRGRTYYTKEQVEQLRKAFNRSTLRSVAYDIRSVESTRVWDKDYGDTGISVPFYTQVNIGTASESEKTRARRLASEINKRARGYDKFSDKTKENIGWSLFEIRPEILQTQADMEAGRGIIDVQSVEASDMDSLLSTLGYLMENTEISEGAREVQEEEMENALGDLGDINLNQNVTLTDVYQLLKDFTTLQIVDSYVTAQVRIKYYEDWKVSLTPSEIKNAIESAKDVNDLYDKIRKIKQLKAIQLGRSGII